MRVCHPKKYQITQSKRSVIYSGGDSVVAFESVVDFVRRDGALAADAPVVTAEFHNGGRQRASGVAAIEDEWETVAKLAKHLIATLAGGGAGNIGTGAGQRHTEFGDEIDHDFVVGPTQRDAACICGHFERKPVGRIDDDGEWARPASLRKPVKIVGQILGQHLGVDERIDENGQSAMLGASFHAENFFDGGEIYGICGESVKSVRGHSNHGTTI